MPVLVDPEAGEVLPESSIVMEYVDAFAAERPRLLPGDRRAALEVRRVVDEARPYRELFPLPWPADMDALDPVGPPPGAAT